MAKDQALELRAQPIVQKLCEELKTRVQKLKEQGLLPKLAIVRLGENADDCAYERMAIKRLYALGMEAESVALKSDVAPGELAAKLKELDADNNIHGILLMRPLPAHFDETKLRNCISITKDVDGMTFASVAALHEGQKAFAPCTAASVMTLLQAYDIELSGKHVAIIGRSAVVGRPLFSLMLAQNATVTVCHSKTQDLARALATADIIVVAIGKAEAIDASFIPEGSVVVDVGINCIEDGRLVGDCADNVAEKASAVSPVPGGVGSLTTVMLAEHLCAAAEQGLL